MDSPAIDSNTEIITATSYISTLLQRLVSERLLVSVQVEGVEQPLTTTVLCLIPSDGVFILDDLFPQQPVEAISVQTQLHIEAHFDGASLEFTAQVEACTEEDGMRFWRMVQPDSIRYQQARSVHRVVVSSLEIPVRLRVGQGLVLKGQLYDMSEEGIGIRLSKAAGIKRGKAYRCSIDHSDDESVVVEVSPNRADKVDGALPVQIGANLHNMSRHDMLQWNRFVTEIERRVLRQH